MSLTSIPPEDYGAGIVVDKNDTSSDTSSDNDCGDSERHAGKTKRAIQEARSKWAMIHFYVIRPAFTFSLLLYMASVTSARGALTFDSGVVNPIRNLVTLIQMESNAYTTCVKQSSIRTKHNLEKLAKEDDERAADLLHSKRAKIKRIEELAGKCFQNAQKARGSLIQWREDNIDIPWMEVVEAEASSDNQTSLISISSSNRTCTVQRRNQTEQLLGRDYKVAEDRVNTAWDNYVSDSKNSLEAISDYAMERFDYDWNYFIKERVQPALDYLAEQSVSIQMMGVNFDYNVTAIEDMIQTQMQILQRELEQAKQHIDTLQKKLEEFRGSIYDLYVNYNVLYERMIEASKTVYAFLPPGMALPDVFDLSDLHLGEYFLPPTGLNWPEMELDYTDIQQKVEEVTQACLNIVVQILDNVQIQSMQDFRGVVQQFVRELTTILELKGYDPPQFQGSHDGISDIDQELQFHSQLGEETMNWTAHALNDLRAPSSLLESVTFGDVETPEFGDFDYNINEDASTTFELLSIIAPKLEVIEYVLTIMSLLGGYAFVLDILCGFFQWWRLSSIYESGAMPFMPEINFGDDDHDGRERPQTNYKILLFIVKSFMNPFFVGFLSVFSLIAFLIITFWIPHVQQMCVDSTNGTWLANNMLVPALANIAAAEGNSNYLLAEHTCYSEQNRLCTRIGMGIEKQMSADQFELQSFQAQHQRSVDTLQLMADCIDTPNMTQAVIESCCGLKGYKTVECLNSNYVCPIDFSASPPSAYRPIETYFNPSSCLKQLQEWNLEDEKFECTNLKEACDHIPCSGVNDEFIRKHATQTDCKVELWIIDSCRFWSAVIFHFIALYGTCTLIYLGLRDIHWREISPDSIRLRTLLRENGELAKGHKLRERIELISHEIEWFQRKARLQVIMGAIMISSYIIVVLIAINKH